MIQLFASSTIFQDILPCFILSNYCALIGSKGKSSEFTGKRTAARIVAFVKGVPEETVPDNIDSDVVELTSVNYKDYIRDDKITLVAFIAPWCDYCRRLGIFFLLISVPVYEKAAKKLRDTAFKIARVDCTVHTTLCGEYGIAGYPTLRLFK